jgi:hypothetical protein
MTTPTPQFIDINAPFEENPEPSWKRTWQGEELLWKVFWGWFLGGHGVILGCSIGFMVIAMILGFAVSPTSLNAGVVGLASGAALLVLTIVPYSCWISVSLWRCAPNCLSKKWFYAVRVGVVIYAISILIPILKIFYL